MLIRAIFASVVDINSHFLWSCIITPVIGLKKLALVCYPIRSETQTNRDSLAQALPRFRTATYGALIGSLGCLGLETLLRLQAIRKDNRVNSDSFSQTVCEVMSVWLLLATNLCLSACQSQSTDECEYQTKLIN